MGLMKKRELTAREERLTNLRWETVQLKTKIQSSSISLLDAFEESTFFRPAAEEMNKGVSAEKAVLPLGKGIKGFDMFAKGLLGETMEDQIGNTEVFLKILDAEIEEAREETQKMGKLYLGGGLMAGIAVCIIMA